MQTPHKSEPRIFFARRMGRKALPPKFVDLRFGRMLVWALLATGLFMFFADPAVMSFRKDLPAWVIQDARLFSHLGNGNFIFWPLGLLLLLLLLLQRLDLGRTARTTLAALNLRLALILSAIAVPGVLSAIAKGLIGRLRPRVLYLSGDVGFDPFSWTAEASSFPSGHTTIAFAAAFILSTLLPKLRVPFFMLAGCVGLSRIVLGAHYPSDVIGGAVFGTLFACVAVRVFASRGLSLTVTHAGAIKPKPLPRSESIAALASAAFATLRRRAFVEIPVRTGENI